MQKRDEQRLREHVDRQAERLNRARRERRTVLAQTAFLGTLGVMLTLPIVVGAYLGEWLDSRQKGYSISWTVNLIVLGVIVGAVNVYLFIRERG